MAAWPKNSFFFTDYDFLSPNVALTLSPLGVGRDFVWNEIRSLSFIQGLRSRLDRDHFFCLPSQLMLIILSMLFVFVMTYAVSIFAEYIPAWHMRN